jgi:hypothetical protein
MSSTQGITPTWNTFALFALPILATQVGFAAVSYLLDQSDQPALIAINVMIGIAVAMVAEMVLTEVFKSNDGVISARENSVLLLFITLKILFGFMLPSVMYAIIKDDLKTSPPPTVLQLFVLATIILMLIITYTGFIARTLFDWYTESTKATTNTKGG